MAISRSTVWREYGEPDLLMPGMFTVEDVPEETIQPLWRPADGPICEPCWLRHRAVRPVDRDGCTHGGAS